MTGELASPTAHEAVEAREQLRRKNEDYLRALRAGDSGVFLRHYPQLFGGGASAAMAAGEHPDEMSEDMVAEAQTGGGGGEDKEKAAG